MNITEVRVRLITKENEKLKAIATITIDNAFAIHDIKVVDGAKGIFIAFPAKKTMDGEFKDIAHPINTEVRNMIQDKVLEAYYLEKNKETANQ